jgi:hypothetical protein
VPDSQLLLQQVLQHARRMLDAEPLLQAVKLQLESRLFGGGKEEEEEAHLGADSEVFSPAHKHRQLAERLVRQVAKLPGAASVLPSDWQETLQAGVLLRQRLQLYGAHLKKAFPYKVSSFSWPMPGYTCSVCALGICMRETP